jgi:acetyl-CoA acyltransferase
VPGSGVRGHAVITAGNSSQISDGAAALLVTSYAAARRLHLTPRARIAAMSVTATDPILMLTGPIPATEKVLARAGLTVGDIGVFEVNEAFAPVVGAWLAETGADPRPRYRITATGHFAYAATCWLTEPSTSPAKPP